MLTGTLIFPFSLFTVFFCILALFLTNAEASHGSGSALGHLVQKQERKPLVLTENGEISAAEVTDGIKGPFHLQFITMEPISLFLPVLLHADMVFYVHTGSGTLSWTDDDEIRHVNVRKGDIHRLHPGSVFYIQSGLEPEREKLRIYAIFSNTEDSTYEPSTGAYSSINDLVLGFDSKVLQAAFTAPEDVIEEILKATKPPAIIRAVPKKKKKIFCEWQARLLKAFLGSNRDSFDVINGKKKKKTKAFNVLEADPDFRNCNGWSLTVDGQSSRLLSDSNIGVFMVNLTKGSMMGPHWNPRASEIAVVLQGQGIIRVVCPTAAHESECKNLRFRVKEGDVFAVPKFHPMAQMSFNNDSFVFMGFSTSTKRNYPQFLAGKSSVFQLLDTQILAVSFNVTNTTIDQLLAPQKEAVILECTSCAEEEEIKMEEEIEREREEEEEARKKEDEEARKRQEEEDRKREEEEAKKKKEKEEEAKKKEEEKARKKREKEEAKKREEEETRKRKEEEEEAEKGEEEEARERREEEARRQEEERHRREREEERRQEETQEQEEEKKQKEKERGRKEEKERREQRRKREEAAAREQEEARRQEERRQRGAEQEEEEEARREREKQGGQPEQPETEGSGDKGERRLPK